MNNETYNHLVNIHRCFTYENPEDTILNMIKGKQRVLDKSTLISTVKKRGNNIKIWAKRYAVISGSYIYFYREAADLIEEESFFLKDAHITDVSDKLGEKYALEIKSKFGNELISFETHAAKDTWKSEIHKIALELTSRNNQDEEVAKKEIEQAQKQKNSNLFILNAGCPEIRLSWYEMDSSVWMVANLKGISLMIKKPIVGFHFYLGIATGHAESHAGVENYDVIATTQKPDQSGNFIEVELEL